MLRPRLRPLSEHRGWCQISGGAVAMVLCARCAAWWGAQGACVCASQPPANISSLQRRRRCYSATRTRRGARRKNHNTESRSGCNDEVSSWQSREQMHIRARRETTRCEDAITWSQRWIWGHPSGRRRANYSLKLANIFIIIVIDLFLHQKEWNTFCCNASHCKLTHLILSNTQDPHAGGEGGRLGKRQPHHSTKLTQHYFKK